MDMVFLPGFNEPTLAILYAPEPTWTGRLENVNGNCLVSLVTLAAGSAKTTDTNETTAVVIATSPQLPYSCLSVHACPPALGGALIVTANGILHFEQGGKLQGVATTGWFSRESGPVGRAVAAKAEPTVKEGLEGSQLVFVANDKAVIFCRSGAVLELVLETSGRTVSSMKIQRAGSGVPASCVERIRGSVGQFGERGYVFVGSEVGEPSLVGWEIGGAGPGAAHGAGGSSLPVKDEMDLDDDLDIFGESSAAVEAEAVAAIVPRARKARSLTLTPLDTLLGYGGIRNMTVGLVDHDSPAELVAATGAGPTAGLTVFHRSICPRKRRRLDLAGLATSGIWSLPIESEVTGQGNVLITSDGFTTRLSKTIGGETSDEVEHNEVTVAAFATADRSTLVQVTSSAIRLLAADLSSGQATLLSNVAVRAVFSEPYLSIVDQTGAVALFELDSATGAVSARPAPAEWTASGTLVSVYHDSRRQVPLVRPVDVLAEAMQAIDDSDEEDELYATAPKRKIAAEGSGKLELVIDPTAERGAKPGLGGGLGWHWSATVDSEGKLQLRSLPSHDILFEASGVTLFPDVIEDGSSVAMPEDLDEDDVEVERIACVAVGQASPRPHLAILLKNGALAVYEAFPSISAAASATRPATLGVRFVKVLTKRLPNPPPRRRGAAPEDFPPAKRELVPFNDLNGYTGVFVTGEEPAWLVAADHGPAQLYDHGEKGVYSFSPVAFEAGDGIDFVVQSKQGASVAGLPREIGFDRTMPITRVPVDRQYGELVFDLDSGLYVGGTLNETPFASFTEDGEPVFTADGPDLTEPTNYRSTVELIVPGTWQAIDGYEFRPNEFISAMKSVSLHSKSTLSGRKEFVAVGTTVYRGEDLAARGGIYIFEVIKVVADPARPDENCKLRLLFFEDTKSVVGNVCDMEGYLVMSMGQKLYVRALELDEVLLAVGFLDVGVHVTSLSALKNFLLIGDALQSVTLVAFQEDPYKLILLGRDYRAGRTSSATFLVNDGRVAFVACDLDGVLRVFEYDPTNIASHAGMKLMCRTEYHAGAEALTTLLYTRRHAHEDVRQNGILFGGVDGSLYTLAPAREAVFRRLQRLQDLMTRHVQHFAGLNPRAWRMVKNDTVSRAITKGVLDGELLARFQDLSLDKQMALAGAVGTDPDTVLLNMRNLAAW